MIVKNVVVNTSHEDQSFGSDLPQATCSAVVDVTEDRELFTCRELKLFFCDLFKQFDFFWLVKNRLFSKEDRTLCSFTEQTHLRFFTKCNNFTKIQNFTKCQNINPFRLKHSGNTTAESQLSL